MTTTIIGLMEAYGIERVTKACRLLRIIDHHVEGQINAMEETIDLLEAARQLTISLERLDRDVKQQWFRIEDETWAWGAPDVIRHHCAAHGVSCEQVSILEVMQRDLRLRRLVA